MKTLQLNDLNKIFDESKGVDEKSFAKMRSSILFAAGQHYVKKPSELDRRIDGVEVEDKSKTIKATKNYVGKIVDEVVDDLVKMAPDASVFPKVPDDIRHQKSSELNNSVLSHYKKKLDIQKQMWDYSYDLVTTNECAAKVFTDPSKGRLLGYDYLKDEEGNIFLNELGQPIEDKESPIMSGQLRVIRLYPFNIMFDPYTENIDESPYVLIKSLVSKQSLKPFIKKEELDNFNSDNESYLIFDPVHGGYGTDNKSILLKEIYYKPSIEYPNGYYYIFTQNALVSHGELPNGIFPIVHEIMSRPATMRRGECKLVNTVRDTQNQLNKTSSLIGQSLMDYKTKVLTNRGTKIQKLHTTQGLEFYTLQGSIYPSQVAPQSGERYLPFQQELKQELRELGDRNKTSSVLDGRFSPLHMLYVSSEKKSRYYRYANSAQRFLEKMYLKMLETLKYFLSDDEFIAIAGRNESVNIQEFKRTTPNEFQIKLQAVSGDYEESIGMLSIFMQLLQYAGEKIEKDEIGRFLTSLKALNFDEAFKGLTMNYDNVQNIVLALERGERPEINPSLDPTYVLKFIDNSMMQPYFKTLHPQVQDNYRQYKQVLLKLESEQIEKNQRLKDGYIPSTGNLAGVDLYVSDSKGGTRRWKAPIDALEWLKKTLETQGVNMHQLERMNDGLKAQIYQEIMKNQIQQENNSNNTNPQLVNM